MRNHRKITDQGAIARTVRNGLQVFASAEACARLRQLRGTVQFKLTSAQLKADR